MDQPLDDPLAVLVERLAGLEVEEADQVDEQEGGQEREQHRRRARHRPRAAGRAGRRRTRQRNPSAVRSARKTEPATFHCTFAKVAQKTAARKKNGTRRALASQSRLQSSSASSSTRACRESARRCSSVRWPSLQLPGPPARVQAQQRLADPLHVVGRDDDARARLAHELGGGAVGGHGGQDRPLGGQVLEDLPARDDPPAAAASGSSSRFASESRWSSSARRCGSVVEQLEPVAEAELRDPLPVGRAEVADEARDDVVEAGLGERGQERARVALAEEAARVRDPEALAGLVLEPGEVVEVASRSGSRAPGRPGRSRGPRRRWTRRPRRPRRRRRATSRDDALERLLLRLHGLPLEAAVGVRDQRVALVGDPRDPGQPLDRGADQVQRDAAGSS